MKSIFSRITQMKIKVFMLMFLFSISTSFAQLCSNPNNQSNSLGGFGTGGKEPLSIDVPKYRSDVYFESVHTFKEMLGINIGVGQDTQLGLLNGTEIDGMTKNIKDVFSHTSAEIVSIRRIANNTDAEAAVQANNILCFAIGECKKLIIPRLGATAVPIQGLVASNGNNSAKNSTDKFNVYPNPAHDNFVTDYNLDEEFNEAYSWSISYD